MESISATSPEVNDSPYYDLAQIILEQFQRHVRIAACDRQVAVTLRLLASRLLLTKDPKDRSRMARAAHIARTIREVQQRYPRHDGKLPAIAESLLGGLTAQLDRIGRSDRAEEISAMLEEEEG